MKRTLLAIAAFAAILSSCQKEEAVVNGNENNEVNNPMSFTATILSTRTTLKDQSKVYWSANDSISINGEIFKADTTKTPTIFTRDKSEIKPPYKAIFPSSLVTNDSIYVLPEKQTYTAGTANNLPMYAKSSSNELTFKNICAVLGVTVKSSDMASVKSIKVSCSNVDMCGTFTVDTTSLKAVLKSNSNSKKSVVLECSEAVSTADDGTVFYIALPEADYENLTVELSADGTSYTKTMNARKNNISMVANTIYPWNFLPVGYYPLSVDPTVNTAL